MKRIRAWMARVRRWWQNQERDGPATSDNPSREELKRGGKYGGPII